MCGASADPPARNGESEHDRLTRRLLAQGRGEGLRRLLADHSTAARILLRREFARQLDEQELDDALSQAALRAWQARAKLRGSLAPIRTWYAAIARNCARRIRDTKRRQYAQELPEDLAAQEDPGLQPGSAEAVPEKPASGRLRRDLYACIRNLPRLQREVMLADLAAGGAADVEMLCQSLGTSKNTIYVSRARARRALRLAMQRLGHRSKGAPEPDEEGETEP